MFEASSELTSIMEFGFYMKYQTIFLEGVLVRVVIHTIYMDVNYQDLEILLLLDYSAFPK